MESVSEQSQRAAGRIDAEGLALSASEHRAYAQDGFFIRPSVFNRSELALLRAAAERVVALADGAARESDSYEIDGNRYSDAANSTVQFEHCSGSETIRVVEPFHHHDERFDRLRL